MTCQILSMFSEDTWGRAPSDVRSTPLYHHVHFHPTTLPTVLVHLILKPLKTWAILLPRFLLCPRAQMASLRFISTFALPPQPHDSTVPRRQAHYVMAEDALELEERFFF